jgi:hypothetical protein
LEQVLEQALEQALVVMRAKGFQMERVKWELIAVNSRELWWEVKWALVTNPYERNSPSWIDRFRRLCNLVPIPWHPVENNTIRLGSANLCRSHPGKVQERKDCLTS